MRKKLLFLILISFSLVCNAASPGISIVGGGISSPCIFSAELSSNLTDSISRNTATFTRASQATYVGVDGLMYLAAINEARFQDGALLIEPAGTNYCTEGHGENYTGTIWDDWGSDIGTTSIEVATDLMDNTDFPNANWQRIQHTFTGGENDDDNLFDHTTANDSFANGDDVTISFYTKGSISLTGGKTLKIHVHGRQNDGTAVEEIIHDDTELAAVSSTITRITLSGTVSNADTKKIEVMIGNVDFNTAGDAPSIDDTVDLYVCAVNITKNPIAESYIPTTGATASRATETGVAKWAFTDIPKVGGIFDANQTFTMLVQIKGNYSTFGAGNSYGLVSCANNRALLYAIGGGTSIIRSYDQTTVIEYSFGDQAADTWFNYVIQVYYDGSWKFRLGVYPASNGWSSSAWKDVDNFDGQYMFGTDLILSNLAAYGMTFFKNLKFFNKKLSDSEIAGEF